MPEILNHLIDQTYLVLNLKLRESRAVSLRTVWAFTSQKLKRNLAIKLHSVLPVMLMKTIKNKWNDSQVKVKKSLFKHTSFQQCMPVMRVNQALWDTNLSILIREETILLMEDKDLVQLQE